MTILNLDAEDGVYTLSAVNHADTPEACAAISTVVTLIANMAEQKKILMHGKLNDGDAMVIWKGFADGKFLLDVADEACRMLARDYPKLFFYRYKSFGKIQYESC